MNLLYLTEDYLHSKVHNNLIIHMLENKPDLKVYVFVPLRPRVGETLVNNFKEHERLVLVTVPIDISFNRYRVDFWAKIRCKIRLIEKYIPINEIDVIHAATLFTEGCTAKGLQKKYNIPFLVSIRGTDSDFYAKNMVHLWPISYGVIKHANVLAYITPNIKQSLMERWQYRGLKEKLKTGIVINNGIDDIWLNNIYRAQHTIGDTIRILYIGRFDSNKNVIRLIEAVKILHKDINVSLTLIGGDGEEQSSVEQQINKHSDYMEYLGKIYDKQKLIQIARNSDIFAMISHGETFGLVYAECLTQGLPLLYTSKTGFDGMYPQGYVGYSVNSYNVESIVDGLSNVIANYDSIRNNILSLDYNRYDWNSIAKHYVSLYSSIINSNSND